MPWQEQIAFPPPEHQRTASEAKVSINMYSPIQVIKKVNFYVSWRPNYETIIVHPHI